MNSTTFINTFNSNNPREMDEQDYQGWAGVEGTGYVAEAQVDGIWFSLVLDITPTLVTASWYALDEANDADLDWAFVELNFIEQSTLRSNLEAK